MHVPAPSRNGIALIAMYFSDLVNFEGMLFVKMAI